MGGTSSRRGQHHDDSSGEPVRRRHDHQWPSVDTTWECYQRRRLYENQDMASNTNGLEFFGVYLPEPVVELVLSYIDAPDIPSCNCVCRCWKDIICRKSFWKKVYERRGYDWNSVPSHVKNKSNAWALFYTQYLYQLFTKNLIPNHSGLRAERASQARFQGWNIYLNGGDGLIVEEPLRGCNPLPDDPFFNSINNRAFVTSYNWCNFYVQIDLWEAGLTPPVMKISLPFDIICSQMYTSRFDCGAKFKWNLRILNSEEALIMDFFDMFSLSPAMEWNRTEHRFPFKEQHSDKMDDVRYLIFCIQGKDSQFWKGHYGMKFARSCVTIQLKESSGTTPNNDSGDFNFNGSGSDDFNFTFHPHCD